MLLLLVGVFTIGLDVGRWSAGPIYQWEKIYTYSPFTPLSGGPEQVPFSMTAQAGGEDTIYRGEVFRRDLADDGILSLSPRTIRQRRQMVRQPLHRRWSVR